MGEVLFNRVARVQVDEVVVTGLDVQFRVRKALKAEPDTCELTVYNLNEDHRQQLQQLSSVFVRLEAGYDPNPVSSGVNAALNDIGIPSHLPLIFSGHLRAARTQQQGPDWVTVITAGDGDEAKDKRVNLSFGPGATLAFCVEQVTKDLGLGLGTLPQEMQTATLADGGTQFASGIVLSGTAFAQLSRLLDSAGYQWSVQDGEIVIVQRGRAGRGSQSIISPETGLIGSPTIGTDDRVQFKALLQPELLPGRQVRLNSRHVNGIYIVESATYSGDTGGTDWFVDAEARPYL